MERGKIAFAIGLGIIFGAFIAKEINQYFWWLGMIAGGFAGYIAYEYKRVIETIPAAWKIAKTIAGWKPNKSKIWWTNWFWASMFVLAIYSYPLTAFFFLSISPDFPVWLSISTWCLCLAASFVGGVILLSHEKDTGKKPLLLFGEACPKKLALKYNIVTVSCFYLPKGIWKLTVLFCRGLAFGTTQTLRAIYLLPKVICGFIKTLFIMIHSERRLLCAAYAATGVAISHFTGNNIVYGLAGGIGFGLINYEIISIRVLRLR